MSSLWLFDHRSPGKMHGSRAAQRYPRGANWSTPSHRHTGIHVPISSCYNAYTMPTIHPSPRAITVTALPGSPTPEQVAVIFGKCTGCAILESSQQDSTYARHSIFARDPVDRLDIPFAPNKNALQAMIDRIGDTDKPDDSGSDLPFVGGWIGYLSYESGLATERIVPSTDWATAIPSVRMALYDHALIYDHVQSIWFAVVTDLSYLGHASRRDACLQSLKKDLTDAAAVVTSMPTLVQSNEPVAQITPNEYLIRARRALHYVERGDIYQVNLTQRWTVGTNADPLDIYFRLRSESPSPHAGFLRYGEQSVISASPELFLRLRRSQVETRPIKGTRPRIGSPQADEIALSELNTSAKDRAELNMIVDLLRNDLGRVCAYGSVQVVDADVIEKHPTVFHRVGTITGQLADDMTWRDLLRSAFPGGSITGAPKIRAMQIIDELEEVARTVYCGAIGLIGLDGSMAWNVAIRTIVQDGATAYVHAGGAIVADSIPENEYDETLTKAAALFRALGCSAPPRMG